MEKIVDQQEAPFSFEELFFSRTDARGIILAGNSVFQRISQYDWDALIKKPHNIIRHPDMPKGRVLPALGFYQKGETHRCVCQKSRQETGVITGCLRL
jgi:hypothetical protein